MPNINAAIAALHHIWRKANRNFRCTADIKVMACQLRKTIRTFSNVWKASRQFPPHIATELTQFKLRTCSHRVQPNHYGSSAGGLTFLLKLRD